ncbi:hypothetical protein J3R82DRAFT_657 [Butyriboletus roseoflavus]|nr:hypothetical protein J3R82DRAFT_657 [Butyriboletus roseoflavus]
MADVDLISPTPDSHVSLETVPASQDPPSDARGEHEASDVVDQDPNAQVEPEIVQDTAKLAPSLDERVKDVGGDLHEATQEDVFTEPGPASITEVSKKADGVPSKCTTPANKDKATALAKSVSGKLNSSTPTDKKASNSATLSAGNAKAAPPGKTTSSPLSKTATATPSTAKKPTTTSSANPTKTATMASSRGSGSGPAPPSRRSSMLPPRAPSATGAPLPPKSRTSTLLASLASSASSKPPPTEVNATSRPSVVSPVGSVASLKSNATGSAAAPPSRPRASVSEAVRRTPSNSRQSLPPAAAPPPQARAMRPMGSISSIREVRDDGNVLDDLQEKLREANESLSTKSGVVTTLEAKILQLEVSLSEALVDVRTKTSSIEQLQIRKQTSDADISGLKARLQQVETEHSHDLAVLKSVSEELKNANESMAGHAESIRTLEAHIETLQADIAAAQENFESLRSSSDQSAVEAAAAAQMEREAFLRAKADVETVTAEVNSLRAAHNKALQDAAARSNESQEHAAEVIALTARIGELKAERIESAAKISELEVEILELKESQENAEDEHKRTLDRLQKLESEFMEAVAATQQVLRDAEARNADSTQKATDAALLHTSEVELIQTDLAQAIAEVEALRAELAAVHAAHDETKAAAHASNEVHEQEMEETEQSYLSKHIELSEEIKRLTAELEAVEAKYDAKVDAVRDEHDQLLQEAFERAKASKNEAGEVHGQDLLGLRAESQATIEQLRAAHQSTVNGLQAEHEAILESQVSAIEKKFHSQSLELRATQDDLSKAKAGLDTSHVECESLRAQLEDARTNFIAASANADQAGEVECLTKEIANLRDENVMLNDVLAVTKESLSEMSTNHSKELEEAARVRVEEVMRLHSIHDGELSTLAAQKSELALSLSDMEGEIAMLRAQLAAVEPAVAPRSNGTVHVSATTVTRDELQKVHEAHNLKMHDLETEHDRVVRGMRMEVDTLQGRLDEVQQDVARKSMEIQYLEQEQEESQDSITRYVKVFGLQSLFGVVIALAVIFDFI